MSSAKHNIDSFFVELDFLLELFLSDEPMPKEEKEKIVESIRNSKEVIEKLVNETDRSR